MLAPVLSADYSTFTSPRFTILLQSSSSATAALTALNAPITKVWTWWFPLESIHASKISSLPAAFDAFVEANVKDADGVEASAGGWREEEDVIREIRARSFTGFVGVREVGDFNMGPPPFPANVEGRVGMGMRTFPLGSHGEAVVGKGE